MGGAGDVGSVCGFGQQKVRIMRLKLARREVDDPVTNGQQIRMCIEVLDTALENALGKGDYRRHLADRQQPGISFQDLRRESLSLKHLQLAD
jgi:hypothetical protein